MKKTLHHPRMTTSLLAVVFSTFFFSVALKFTADATLPPQKAAFSSVPATVLTLFSIFIGLYGIYRFRKPKVIISLSEESFTLPEQNEVIPYNEIESIEACRINVSPLGASVENALIDDGICLTLINDLLSEFKSTYSFSSSPRKLYFSTTTAGESRAEIIDFISARIK